MQFVAKRIPIRGVVPACAGTTAFVLEIRVHTANFH